MGGGGAPLPVRVRMHACCPPHPPSPHAFAVAELLRARGVPHVLFWPEEPTALIGGHFAGTLTALLAHPDAKLLEAYAIALYAVQAHCGVKQAEGGLSSPAMPDLLSVSSFAGEEGGGMMLPDNASVPLPEEAGLDLSKGVAAAVEGEGGRPWGVKGCAFRVCAFRAGARGI